MEWIQGMMPEMIRSSPTPPVCFNPPEVRGSSLFSLPRQSFECADGRIDEDDDNSTNGCLFDLPDVALTPDPSAKKDWRKYQEDIEAILEASVLQLEEKFEDVLVRPSTEVVRLKSSTTSKPLVKSGPAVIGHDSGGQGLFSHLLPIHTASGVRPKSRLQVLLEFLAHRLKPADDNLRNELRKNALELRLPAAVPSAQPSESQRLTFRPPNASASTSAFLPPSTPSVGKPSSTLLPPLVGRTSAHQNPTPTSNGPNGNQGLESASLVNAEQGPPSPESVVGRNADGKGGKTFLSSVIPGLPSTSDFTVGDTPTIFVGNNPVDNGQNFTSVSAFQGPLSLLKNFPKMPFDFRLTFNKKTASGYRDHSPPNAPFSLEDVEQALASTSSGTDEDNNDYISSDDVRPPWFGIVKKNPIWMQPNPPANPMEEPEKPFRIPLGPDGPRIPLSYVIPPSPYPPGPNQEPLGPLSPSSPTASDSLTQGTEENHLYPTAPTAGLREVPRIQGTDRLPFSKNLIFQDTSMHVAPPPPRPSPVVGPAAGFANNHHRSNSLEGSDEATKKPLVFRPPISDKPLTTPSPPESLSSLSHQKLPETSFTPSLPEHTPGSNKEHVEDLVHVLLNRDGDRRTTSGPKDSQEKVAWLDAYEPLSDTERSDTTSTTGPRRRPFPTSLTSKPHPSSTVSPNDDKDFSFSQFLSFFTGEEDSSGGDSDRRFSAATPNITRPLTPISRRSDTGEVDDDGHTEPEGVKFRDFNEKYVDVRPRMLPSTSRESRRQPDPSEDSLFFINTFVRANYPTSSCSTTTPHYWPLAVAASGNLNPRYNCWIEAQNPKEYRWLQLRRLRKLLSSTCRPQQVSPDMENRKFSEIPEEA
ncbi:unnamed protein product [Cyprideis torosa]|uniref:Uncharacterized protein n=1 Tax=Cyprideis torosa TaxID=163714 RepID=A0A7R8WE21_9CRUS|nr:unnamed protein product [Cyprideis torosa]CAG0892425.1 unnamed protein product [Cyprideis torosa]